MSVCCVLLPLVVLFCSYLLANASKWVQMEPDVHVFQSSKWMRGTAVLPDESIHAVFVLRHDSKAVAMFEEDLLERASPRNGKYGQWMSMDYIKAKFSPPEENVERIVDYLVTNGVDWSRIQLSTLGDKVHVEIPAWLAEKLFNTNFAWFQSLSHGHISLPRITKPYFLPAEIAAVTELVDDILRFPALRRLLPEDNKFDISPSSPNLNRENVMSSKNGEITNNNHRDKDYGEDIFACGDQCRGYTTPAVLQQAYKFSPLQSAAPGNTMAVAEFQLQYYDTKDLNSFSKTCHVNATVDNNIGGNVESICLITGCVEALLDIEYIKAVAGPIPLTVMYAFKFSLMDWLDKVLTMETPPLVHSVSYGNDEVQQTSTSYMFAINQQLMKVAARGVTVVFAAGDQGVWGRSGVTRDQTFHPDFPASSPYVTSVGGTDFVEKSTIGDETAWTCSGGGFSNTFDRPSWQEDAVSAYLKNATNSHKIPNSTAFNASGRAYPDISALAGQVNPYCVSIRGGTFRGVAGTSASAPVIAGLIARLNNIRLEHKKPPMGFLNPFLYDQTAGLSDCFQDVQDGSQNSCLPMTTGFAALSGWDPVTGFGTPNFECLAKKVA